MNVAGDKSRRTALWYAVLLIPLLWLIAENGRVAIRSAGAQDDVSGGNATEGEDPTANADRASDEALNAEEPEEETADDASEDATDTIVKQINYLELMLAGGWFMIPIAAMSLLVVTFGMERLLALRRSKVVPSELIGGLGNLAGQKGGLDPRQAYRLCQQYPSAAASVIKTMLLKVGRPHSEVEHAVSEANNREAARLYSNVRWLTLAAVVSPLLGLLGTVGGMINAFFRTANLPMGANKAEELAGGIYQALVTTLAGLMVAIPAAVLAHFYEGRIQSLFRELDETLLGLMPQLERYEGRLRVSKERRSVVQAELAATEQDPTPK